MDVSCDSSHDSMSLSLLWSGTFPNLPLTSLNINETTPFVASVSSGGSHAIVQSSFNSTYPPFNSTSLSFTWTSMFATVNASGSGAIVIADSSGRAIGCTWVASPRLVQVEVRNWTSFVSSVDHASGFPAPAGRAVFSTLTGISQAIRLGASLYPPPMATHSRPRQTGTQARSLLAMPLGSSEYSSRTVSRRADVLHGILPHVLVPLRGSRHSPMQQPAPHCSGTLALRRRILSRHPGHYAQPGVRIVRPVGAVEGAEEPAGQGH
ncbi:hypothetical protein B0H13DRAFT_187030 [Mycena leptocephala]|nr:hypothetical protein B0H13DRAFT_187030 [Mycena leptocephala]